MNRFWAGIYCTILLLFFLLNQVIPFNMDDLNYEWKMIPGMGFAGEINNWHDYFCSVVSFDGRFITNGLAQLFCGYLKNKTYYNLCATLMCSIWMWLLAHLSIRDIAGDNIWQFALLLSFLFGIYNSEPTAFYCCVVFGMSYLFPSLLCMTVIYLYEKESLSCIQKVILLSTSFFAGYSIELFAVGTATYILVSNVRCFKRLRWYHCICSGLVFVGLICKICDPGNFTKLSEVNHHNYLSVLSRWTMHGELIIFTCVLLLLYFYRRNVLFRFLHNEMPMIAAWATSIIFVSVIGQSVYGRMMLGIELWGFILVIRLLGTLNMQTLIQKFAPTASFLFILFLSSIIYWQNVVAQPLKEVEKQGRDSRHTYALVEYPNIEIPSTFDKFVNPLYPNNVERLCQRYSKNVYFYEQSTIAILHDGSAKVPGDNPFYRRGDLFVSQEPISDTIKVKLSLGFFLGGVKNKVKRIMRGESPQHIICNDIPSQKIMLSPDMAIWICYISEKDFLRHIERIDLLTE